ncbi:FUSC family protein [Achromobacter arsenitoxydans]|uniref:Integral membrane bound transporter domain-containing protein n=1 Tax=Achromobacter arsenitoxydans SY8 TaxID=477184 RepID=H0F6B6_9BURK|nr:FUSC family protein [Achromobacter arsenitoxydans]EHK66088.1 hypothetical protein KYC_11548 [Achromobacter arsenitoxydans SY8]
MSRPSLSRGARASNMRWLMSLAHMEPSPVNPWVMLRAALAIGLPSAAGLALDQSAAAALVALGALPAITGDNGGPYRNRALSIGSTVFGGALGYLLGNLAAGHGLWTSAAMMLLVLAASLIGTFNNIAAVATLQFATYVIVGSSLTSPLPAWLPPVLVGAGGLFGLALTLSGWIVNPVAPERAAVAQAYRKLAAMFAATGTSRVMTARRDMEAAMAAAYDAVLAARGRAAGPSPRLARLAAQLQACTPLTNAALSLARAGRVLPAECARVMNRLADRVENDAEPDARDDIAALRAADMPRSYWVPLIVVVIFKPNFGSVFARALQSCAGSVVGVAISATVLALDNGGIASLLTVAALAALLPWSIRRNYGLFSAILLPILMLLIGALQPGSWPIALARLVDVGVAAAIVLFVGYLPWIRIERNNLDHAVSAAMTTLAAYLNTVFQADPAKRHVLRVQAYARLSDLRIALQRGLSEPRLVSRRALAWWPVEVALERVANAISDTAWSIPAGQAAPAPAQVAQLAAALSGIAQAVDQGVPVQTDAIAAPAPALQDVAAEIESLRAVLAGPDFTAAPGRAATSTLHQV